MSERYPNNYKTKIEDLGAYLKNNPNKYKDHYATLLTWLRKEYKTQVQSRDIDKEIEHINQLMNTEFTPKHEFWEHSVEDGDYKGAMEAMKKKLEELENEKKRV